MEGESEGFLGVVMIDPENALGIRNIALSTSHWGGRVTLISQGFPSELMTRPRSGLDYSRGLGSGESILVL